MNLARELKNHNAASDFDKAKNKVLQALNADPFGLTISQLMTVCRLSQKTLKQIIPTLNLEEENGVYKLSLSEKKKLPLESKAASENMNSKEEAPKPARDPKMKVAKKASVNPPSTKVSGRFTSHEIKALAKREDRLYAVIKQHDGLSHGMMVDLVGDSIGEIISFACVVKKHSNCVEDVKAAGEFIDSLDGKYQDIIQKYFDPSNPEYKPRENEYSSVKNECKSPKSEYKLPEGEIFIQKNEDMPSNMQPEQVAIPSLESCKSLIKTTTVKTHNLFLDKDQIDDLLKGAFGLETVVWRTQGSKILGVQMSRTESIEG